MQPLGVLSMNFRIVLRDTVLRCASEPKHTAWQLRATLSISFVKGMLSQATFSFMSYAGTPFSSSFTCTEPVG